MPTYAHATVVAHLSEDPALKYRADGKCHCIVRAWTKDRDWKDKEKVHWTTWRGIINGPQAEWLARDGRKGSMVVMSGAVRVDLWAPDSGQPRASIEFTRLEDCRLLERTDGEQRKAEDNEDREPAAPATAAPPPAQAPLSPDDEPPF